jgi:glutamate synthase (NADPH/NADH) small chain
MNNRKATADISPGRLPADVLARNFDDVVAPLGRQAALVEANRCYYCFDAPCIQACPTGIDIPHFIRRIATEDQRGAAQTILSANILGGMCARVCPTEILCEGDCVRNVEGDKPIRIGALQRYATDWVYREQAQLFQRAPDTGRKVAVVGAGPAGLACAHALALQGHAVALFDGRPKPGGLNEYGIAAYKVPGFAQAEIDWLLSIGGIELRCGQRLGHEIDLDALRHEFDAVFLGLGLAGVNALGIEGEDLIGVHNAVDFIAELRQCEDLATLPVGRRVIVIGGGNTAIDAAVQSKRLGAEQVTLVYRRGAESMSATEHEQSFAKDEGVVIRHWAAPRRILGQDGKVSAVEFEHMRYADDGRLSPSGEGFSLLADVVLKAIGQTLVATDAGDGEQLRLQSGRIVVDDHYRTSLDGVWAGGDCVASGQDLTVQAVEDGKRAAMAIDAALSGQEQD